MQGAAAVVVASTLAVVYAGTATRSSAAYSPKATVAPVITGVAEVGRELSCTPGTWQRNPNAYTISWENSPTGTTWTPVAPGSPYVVDATDQGDLLRCRVTAANARGSGQAISSTVGPVPIPNPLLIVSDTFTDADDTNLSAHTGEVGATWTKHPSLARDTFITGNRARGDGNTGRSRYYASAVPIGADYDVEAVLNWAGPNASTDLTAIWGRLSTTVDTGYQARWSTSIGPGWELVKVVTGVATRLGSVYVDAPTASETRTVRYEMRGCEHKVYVQAVLRISATDCSITAAGRVGVGTKTSTATLGVHIDAVQAVLPSPTPPECADGIDNADAEDALIDLNDPGCEDSNDNDEFNEPLPQCSNGIDDDGDLAIDFPADTGCVNANEDDETAPPVFICSDGLDNDSDGDTDFPADIGCANAQDADEFNAPVALCADGLDNDSPADGLIDFGTGPTNDPGCTDALDNDEFDVPPPPEPQEGLAQLWMDPNGGTCTRFTAASEYVDAAACGPFNSAYAACQSGDNIKMVAGTYPPGFIPWRATHAAYTNRCVFESAAPPGEEVLINGGANGSSIRSLWIEAENIEFRGVGSGTANQGGRGNLRLGNTTLDLGAQITYKNNSGTANDCQGNGTWADNVALNGLVMRTVTVTCASNITVQNSSITGCAGDCQPIMSDGPVNGRLLNFSWLNNVTSGFLREPCDVPNENAGCAHSNCLFLTAGHGTTNIRGNHFAECVVNDLQFKITGVGTFTGTVNVDSNFFAKQCGNGNPCGSIPTTSTLIINVSACGTTPGCSNFNYRFNTFYGGCGIETLYAVNGTNRKIYGNVCIGDDMWTCDPASTTYGYNIASSGSTCAATDLISTVSLVSAVNFAQPPTSNDFHLAVGASAADNFVPVGFLDGCPVDYDGETRPTGANCDAGADER